MKRFVAFAIGCSVIMSSAFKSSAQHLPTEHDSCTAHVTVAVPKYRIERTNKIDGGKILVLFVSVDSSTAEREDLIILGCALGKKFAARDAISAYFFTDRDAARSYNPQGEGNSRSTISSFRGVYTFVRNKELEGQALDLRTNPNSPYANVEILLGPPPERIARGAKGKSKR
jgi:hypothetical protein